MDTIFTMVQELSLAVEDHENKIFVLNYAMKFPSIKSIKSLLKSSCSFLAPPAEVTYIKYEVYVGDQLHAC